MNKKLKTVLRFIIAGIIFAIGILGFFIPFLQGFLLVVVAIAIAFPTKRKMIMENIKEMKEDLKNIYQRGTKK